MSLTTERRFTVNISSHPSLADSIRTRINEAYQQAMTAVSNGLFYFLTHPSVKNRLMKTGQFKRIDTGDKEVTLCLHNNTKLYFYIDKSGKIQLDINGPIEFFGEKITFDPGRTPNATFITIVTFLGTCSLKSVWEFFTDFKQDYSTVEMFKSDYCKYLRWSTRNKVVADFI